MRTLGIIGGIAPPSTIDYYRTLVSRYRERAGDGSYPSIVIDSIDAQPFFALLEAGDRPRLVEVLLVELDRLAHAGVDVALFASNSPHLVFDEVAARSPLPLISIVEATADAAEALGLSPTDVGAAPGHDFDPRGRRHRSPPRLTRGGSRARLAATA